MLEESAKQALESLSPEKTDMSAPSDELKETAEDKPALSDEELNDSLGEEKQVELKSGDCRSECKYNTGYTYKSSNYGYSD